MLQLRLLEHPISDASSSPKAPLTMTSGGKIRAWIERSTGDAVIAAFIGVATRPGGTPEVANRTPAMRACPSVDTARQWIETEASALGLPVEWVEARCLAHRQSSPAL